MSGEHPGRRGEHLIVTAVLRATTTDRVGTIKMHGAVDEDGFDIEVAIALDSGGQPFARAPRDVPSIVPAAFLEAILAIALTAWKRDGGAC